MSPAVSNRFSPRSILTLIGVLLAAMIGLAAYAWFDHLTSEGETVAGNISFAGRRIDGWETRRVTEAVLERSTGVLTNTVEIDTPDGTVDFALGDLGFSYDIDRAESMILGARHQGGMLNQLVAWVGTAFDPIQIADPVGFNPEAAMKTLAASPALKYSDPINPELQMADQGFLIASQGKDGAAADLDEAVAAISRLDPTKRDLEIEAETEVIAPAITQNLADFTADRINDATRGGTSLIIMGHRARLTPANLRQHIVATLEGGRLVPHIDLPGLQAEIESLFPGPVGGIVNPTFEVDGESVSVLRPGRPASICCDPATAASLADALLAGAGGPFKLRARPESDPVLAAWYDGSLVTEQVSSFTTPHNCCESRVKNIQRMADMVRGYYLVPGEVLSLNEYIGPRTREKGFVAAGAIRGGHLTPEVGGGVSQFATTIFNAAYFAGLDFIEYRAHSQYFSRYPYGREATISNPAPDLKIENTTDYPVLIWTSYTPRSITVSMYSTKNVEAEQIATRTSRRNQCRYVETDRLRTYADGRETIDTFFALYRPADGIDCNGNQIPE